MAILKKPVTKPSSKVGKVVSNVAKKVDDVTKYADEVVDIADDVVDSSKGIQLEEYLKEVESLFGKGWTTVLDTY